MLCGRRFSLWLKGVVYMNYVSPAVLHGSEAWCVEASEMGILHWTERSVVSALCGEQLKDGKRCIYLILGLNETVNLLAMANC